MHTSEDGIIATASVIATVALKGGSNYMVSLAHTIKGSYNKAC